MNPMQHMKDPAAGVPPQLLPHMHLVSKHRYPTVSNLSSDTIVGYLMEAPKIMRDLQPVQWQFLDPPPNEGRLMLVWQPLEHLGTAFASDGYVWADAEQAFKQESRGYTLEMFIQRSGYQAPGEPMANHCRKRYRLLPGNPALPHPDPSLWIVHYMRAAPRDHIPAASIPITPQVHAMMQQRRMIQSAGPLGRKDFMLHDRANWPTINLPPGIPGRNPSVQMQPGHRRGNSVVPGEPTLEEEEDVSRGDIFDFMTPREISRMRYEQHHEWMEEILESHYATKSIIPTDIGLGRKGELEALTRGFFDAPTTVFLDAGQSPAPARVGKMAPGKADEFAKLATSKITEMQAELERLKRKHVRRIEKLKKTASLSAAEKKLRNASFASDEQGQRRLSSAGGANVTSPDSADAIIDEVEGSWGKKIERVMTVHLIEKGGLDERPLNNGSLNGAPSRNVMSPTKASLSPIAQQSVPSQQEGTAPYPAPSHTQPQPVSPQLQHVPAQEVQLAQDTASAGSSSQVDGAEDASPGLVAEGRASPRVNSPGSAEEPTPSAQELDVDIEMAGLEDQEEEPQLDMEDNAWVMVGEDDNSKIEAMSREPSQTNDILPQTSTAPPNATPEGGEPETTSDEGNEAALEAALEAEPAADTAVTDPVDFELSGDFDNVDVDTAGDALDDYGASEDDLNLDTMDDSAFADAFHPREDENTPMDDNDIS